MSPRPLSETGFVILMGLAQSPSVPQHGYALIQLINRQLGREVLLPAALYTTLPKLLAAGLVAEVEPPPDNTDERRRYYKITQEGVKTAQDRAIEQAALARMILSLPGRLKGELA